MAERRGESGARPHDVALTIVTLEARAAGEPLRIVLSGFPDFPGATILEKGPAGTPVNFGRNVCAFERHGFILR